MSGPLRAFKVHVADQVMAALAEAAPAPMSTPQLQDRTGYGPRHGQLVYTVLTRLAASGEVEKITAPGVKPVYWRRLAPVIALPAEGPKRPRQEAAIMTDLDTTARALRRWTANHDLHVRAAVELLIEHETWIRRADFQRACIERNAREAWVNWQKARQFVDVGSTASTSEMAVLDLAVALGENRYRLSIMGSANSRMIAQAVARALGEDR